MLQSWLLLKETVKGKIRIGRKGINWEKLRNE